MIVIIITNMIGKKHEDDDSSSERGLHFPDGIDKMTPLEIRIGQLMTY